jgi:hypothetical protein
MQKKEKLPVKYVINTSSQELHILGNEFYKEHGATLIGPESYKNLIKEQKPLSMLEKLSNVIFTNTRLVPLDVYQEKNTTITIGDTKVEIKKLEKGESKNLVVYLPKEETIFAGNYISNKRVPSLKEHDSLNEWMENLKTIEGLSWKHIISAHGIKRDREALTSTENYLNKIKKTILTSLKTSAKTPLKKIDNKTFGTYEHIAFFKDFHSENIQRAYDELKTNVTTTKIASTQKKSNENIILNAMADIQTNKILKEGTSKTTLVKVSEKKKDIKEKETTKKGSIKKGSIKEENIKIAKVEITKETSVQAILEEAAITEVAPTTEEVVPFISYDKDFYTAQQHAIKEHKMVFIKIEADNCIPCNELDQELASNKTLRKMINKYTTAIKINTSYETVPLGLTNRGTPTVIVINPETERVLVQLEGMEKLKYLEESLKSVTNDPGSLALNY